MHTFTDWFRDTLQRKGQTYVQAAAALGVSPSTCWQWAKGQRTPRIEKLLDISQWGGVGVERLVGYVDTQIGSRDGE